MIANLLMTVGAIFMLAIGGILVERLYRRFARHNPQLGPFRKEGHQDCCSCTAASGCNGDTACGSPSP
jgi:hypothetical protein